MRSVVGSTGVVGSLMAHIQATHTPKSGLCSYCQAGGKLEQVDNLVDNIRSNLRYKRGVTVVTISPWVHKGALVLIKAERPVTGWRSLGLSRRRVATICEFI
jgi:hypothetical protein